MQPGKHGPTSNASWCAGSSVLEIASPSAADVQRSRFGLASGASFTAPWSSVIPRTIFFRALDASTRGFWSVYDSSGLLARARATKVNFGRAGRRRSQGLGVEAIPAGRSRRRRVSERLSDTQRVRNSGKGSLADVSSRGGVTPERSVLSGAVRAGSPATLMPAGARHDRKAQPVPARQRSQNCYGSRSSRRCSTSDRSRAWSRASRDGGGVFARWCLA